MVDFSEVRHLTLHELKCFSLSYYVFFLLCETIMNYNELFQCNDPNPDRLSDLFTHPAFDFYSTFLRRGCLPEQAMSHWWWHRTCHFWVFSKLSLPSLVPRSRVTKTWQALTPTACGRKHCPSIKPRSAVFYIIESSKNLKHEKVLFDRIMCLKMSHIHFAFDRWTRRRHPSASTFDIAGQFSRLFGKQTPPS